MDETEEEQPGLVKKSHCKSVVWNYFGLESNEDDVPIKEKEDTKLVIKPCSLKEVTRRLHDHHPELYAEA